MTSKDKISDNITEDIPDWLAGFVEKESLHMDVRPILATGTDPLNEILKQIALVPPGTNIVIEASFNPVPLRRLLAGKGYDSYGVQVSGKHWKIYFQYVGNPQMPSFPDMPDFPIEWRNGILEMDLRAMAPPNPMVAVLMVIEGGDVGDEFLVRLDRDPIYLHPELIERHWTAEVIEDNEEGITIRIFKLKGKGAPC